MENEELDRMFKEWAEYTTTDDFINKLEEPLKKLLSKIDDDSKMDKDGKWELHPVWDKIYKLTEKETEKIYYSVMVQKSGTDRLFDQSERMMYQAHSGATVMYEIDELKERYDIEVGSINGYTPKSFMEFLLEGVE